MRAHRSTHMRSQEREPHLERAGVGEIHMDMSEEPFCMEIYRKKRPWTAPRQDASKKNTSENRKSMTKSEFVLPVPGGRMHELVQKY